MRLIVITQYQKDFIEQNWYKMSYQEMASHLNISVAMVTKSLPSILAKDELKNTAKKDVNYPLPYAKDRVIDMLSRLQALKTRDVRIYEEIAYMRYWLQYVEEL